MRLKVLSVSLMCAAATALSPGAASATVRPQFYACNPTLEMWPNTTGGISVAGGYEAYCGGPVILAYLTINKVSANGTLTTVASGLGGATYQCQGTAWTEYAMGGNIPDGESFSDYYACG